VLGRFFLGMIGHRYRFFLGKILGHRHRFFLGKILGHYSSAVLIILERFRLA
jgi:hypothetical protein